MIRPILRHGDSILHEPARAVEAITEGIERLVDDMIETMYAAPGVGLAAPQVGVPLRLFVVDISIGRDPAGLLVLINPEFVERDGMQLEEEGCLSVPGFEATVVRPARVVVKGLDRPGTEQTHEGTGPPRARVPARDGPPRRHALRRSSARHQTRSDRAQDSQALPRGQMVNTLRIVFFGTPEFAVPTLDALLGSPHPVVAVVTQPDRPRGRGRHTTAAPVKARALAAGVPVLQPERMKDPAFLEGLQALHADLGVVAAYGKILTDAVLATPRLGMINVHASLLPRYRGAAPVHRAIIAGERETGVTIMRVVKALDAGPMLATASRPISADETSDDVEHDLARIGAGLLLTSVDALARGPVQETPQDDAAASYAHRLTKEDGAIDWSQPAEQIHNRIRGLHPWPHAFTLWRGQRLILLRSAVLNEPSDLAPGTLLESAADRLVVATGRGRLLVRQLQAEGKRAMQTRDFLAGHALTVGDRFSAAP